MDSERRDAPDAAPAPVHPYVQVLTKVDLAEDAVRAWVVEITRSNQIPGERLRKGTHAMAAVAAALEQLVNYELGIVE